MNKRINTILIIILLLASALISTADNIGDIADAVVDSYEWDTADGRMYNPDGFIRLGDSNYFMTSGTGELMDGFLTVIEVSDVGVFNDSVIDEWEYDTSDGLYAGILHISGDIYAVYYMDAGNGVLFTTRAWSSNGTLQKTMIDSENYTKPAGQHLIHVTGDIYALSYQENGGGYDHFLETYEITSAGAISARIDVVEYDDSSTSAVLSRAPHMALVDNNTVAIVMANNALDGRLYTYNISDTGDITNNYADYWEFDGTNGEYPHIKKIAGNVFAIVYEGSGSDGFVKTLTIADNGSITKSWIDELEFDIYDCYYPTMFTVADASVYNPGVYGITYKGPGNDGFVKTMNITRAGDIGTVIDSLAFDTVYNYYFAPTIHIADNFYVICYTGPGMDGWAKTVNIKTPRITISDETPADGAINVSLDWVRIYDENFDFNGDGILNEKDMDFWHCYYLQTVPPAPEEFDFNGDGVLNFLDISLMVSSYASRTYGILLSANVTHIDNIGGYPTPKSVILNTTFYSNYTGEWEQLANNSYVTDICSDTYELLYNTTLNQLYFDDFNPPFKWNTTYYWSLNVTDDAGNWTNKTFSFTTALQELNITYAYPNNTHIEPDASPEYLQVNISSTQLITPATAYFSTNISGSWEIFDTVKTNYFKSDQDTFYSTNLSWVPYGSNVYWRVNITSGGVWANSTVYNFTTERCYQIFSYDEVFITEPVYNYIRYGDIRSQCSAWSTEDLFWLSLHPSLSRSIEIIYNSIMPETTITNFKFRLARSIGISSLNPKNYFKLYINGIDYGYADDWVDFTDTPGAQPNSNPKTSGDAFPVWRGSGAGGGIYKYLEWKDINATISGRFVFEINKPAGVGTTSTYGWVLIPGRIEWLGEKTFDGSNWYGYDIPEPAMDDRLIMNMRVNTGNVPNGVWDGDLPRTTGSDPWRTSFGLNVWRSPSATPFTWRRISRSNTANSGAIYEFTTKVTEVYGEYLLPDTYPKNNSVNIETNPDLECHIITNLSNFTIDMNPVFVSVQTNYSGAWAEIWNNTGNYSESFTSVGTFRINSSQYNFSFDKANTIYYWRVCSRKLSPGAEWTNRTFNFRTVLITADFNYTFITPWRLQFNQTADGPIDYYIWDFGDFTQISGRYGEHKNPIHLYKEYGSVTVILTVVNETTGFKAYRSYIITVGDPDPDPETPILVTIGHNFYWLIPIIGLLIAIAIIKIVMKKIKELGDM